MNKNAEFDKILAENKDKIFRICCAYEKDKDDRDDLFQQILINLWKSLDNFKGLSSLSTWVYRVAVNTSLVHVKSAVTRKNRFTALSENTNSVYNNSDADEKLETERQTRKLYGCINMLAEFDRLIISLVLEDMSYKEISEITGITVNNVGVKINRIKKELARLLGE
ncbi:MAG: ECF subfamily RNA polymerase sigma-70 factor [Chlorobi bacterium OLB5]|nr:MAG: ECF subfamily RNA polymerase sigma-70 factor [Chlorobi bacterium OLB5]